MRALRTLGPVLLATLAGACTAAPVMPDTDAVAAIVREAGEAGGREDPAALYYLDLADRELLRARVLVEARDPEGARRWARRAEADADVARLLAVEAAARAAALRTEEHAAALFRTLEAPR
jgi:hypothetical protein